MVSRDQLTGCAVCTPQGTCRPAPTRTTWPSRSSPYSKAASCSPRSSGTPVLLETAVDTLLGLARIGHPDPPAEMS